MADQEPLGRSREKTERRQIQGSQPTLKKVIDIRVSSTSEPNSMTRIFWRDFLAKRQRLGPTSSRQSSRRDNVQHPPPEAHTYMTPGNYGHPPSVLGMGNMASALPDYPSGPVQFDEQGMQQQQFVPVAASPGLVYGMPQFQSFPAPATNPNLVYNAPYPQVYVPYVQQQQGHPGARLSDASAFSPIPPTAPSPGSVQRPADAYGQSYFHPYAPRGHHARPLNLSPAASQAPGQSHSSTRKTNEDGPIGDNKRITIVDGSKQASAQGPSAGEYAVPSRDCANGSEKLTVVDIARSHLTSIKVKHAKSTTAKTETIWQCFVGWESCSRDEYRRAQGSFLARCYKGP